MAAQFEYPERGWSVGKMRKRGERLAEMRMGPTPTFEMDRAAGAGLASRGGVFGTAARAPSDIVGGQMTREIASQVQAHKEQIQDGVNQVASGSMDSGMFDKLLKKLGWGKVKSTGEYTDPQGTAHVIEPQSAQEQQ